MSTIDYTNIDPEVVDLVMLLNEFPGFRTYDSCFGHKNSFNHYFFINFIVDDEDNFIKLVSTIMIKTFYGMGKVYLNENGHASGFSLIFNKSLLFPTTKSPSFDQYIKKYSLTIHSFNDPSTTEKGIEEKIKGIEFVRRAINEFSGKEPFNVKNGKWYENG